MLKENPVDVAFTLQRGLLLDSNTFTRTLQKIVQILQHSESSESTNVEQFVYVDPSAGSSICMAHAVCRSAQPLNRSLPPTLSPKVAQAKTG